MNIFIFFIGFHHFTHSSARLRNSYNVILDEIYLNIQIEKLIEFMDYEEL